MRHAKHAFLTCPPQTVLEMMPERTDPQNRGGGKETTAPAREKHAGEETEDCSPGLRLASPAFCFLSPRRLSRHPNFSL